MAEHPFIESIRTANEAQNATWRAAYNPIVDEAPQVRRWRNGYIPEGDEPSLEEREATSQARLSVASKSTTSTTPSSWDWRNVGGRNFISSVKNQGQCGSCVAFGTCAVMEGMVRTIYNIAVNDSGGGVLPNLSEAQLFFCGAGQACQTGWYVSAALSYATTNGVAPDGCFPYSDHNQSCNLCPNWKSQVTQISASSGMNNVDQMKQWLSTKGPLITCFSVYSDFYGYSSGVYHHTSGDYEGGHCVACIGYSDDLQAWLCKNSWGTGWGENGYFWIGYGQCGIDAYMWSVNQFSVAYPLFNGFLARTNLSDVGGVPSPSPASTCPDIIPTGALPDPDPQVTFTNDWFTDPGENILASQQNFIYVRAKNLAPSASGGTVSLYYSPASLLLWPSTWSHNTISTSTNTLTSTLTSTGSGKIAVGVDPFLWTPPSLSSGDHYCLISRVVTPSQPNPIPADFSTMDQFASWIQNNPNNGWRNVAMVNKDTPTVQVTVQLALPLATATPLYVVAECVNLPVGSEVQFAAGSPGPVPPLAMPKTAITMSSQILGILTTVPANYSSAVVVSFWNNGNPVGAGASLSLVAFYPVEASSPLAERSTKLPAELVGIGPEEAVEVGRFTILLT